MSAPLATDAEVRPLAEALLGRPLALRELKLKPGRRRTLRAAGPRGRAIVKSYASGRAPVVAGRLRALAGGPSEPMLPRVLVVQRTLRVVVLSEVPGRPLRESLIAGDTAACARAGTVLAAWHRFWAMAPPPLGRHTAVRELGLLHARATTAPPAIAREVESMASSLAAPWRCRTVVHRDLYEEQLVLGERVGLIDLDDAALGPPELDLGNLLAHLELLEARTGRSFRAETDALLAGYRVEGELDDELLDRCRKLSLLRLACIHGEINLLEPVTA